MTFRMGSISFFFFIFDFFLPKGTMIQWLHNQSLGRKFGIIIAGVVVLIVFNFIGIYEVAKTGLLQYMEREHIHLTIQTLNQLEEFQEIYQETGKPPIELVTRESEDRNLKGMKPLLEEAIILPIDCLGKVTYKIEQILFTWVGYGEAFVLCEIDIVDLDNALTTIDQYIKQQINTEQFIATIVPQVDKVAQNSNRFAIVMPEARIFVEKLVMVITVVLSILVLALVVVLAKEIKDNIHNLAERLTDIAEGEGDLTQRLIIQSNDEVGETARQFNQFVEKLHSIIFNMSGETQKLLRTSNNLGNTTEEMSRDSVEMKEQIDRIANNSEEVTTNVNTVAASAEETAANIEFISTAVGQLSQSVQSVSNAAEESAVKMSDVNSHIEEVTEEISGVASTVEQMSGTLNNIHANTQKAMAVANEANDNAKETLNYMNQLGETAGKIGQIVKLINSIASQTNMLALNATIEAASAGEAGKGFAVVATEVKELSQQTADANNEIAQQIEQIQAQTTAALEHTELVGSVISEVKTISQLINSDVQKQSMRAKKTSQSAESMDSKMKASTQNIIEVNDSLQQISKSISEAAKTATETSYNVTEGTIGVREIAKSANFIASSVQDVNSNLQETQSLINHVDEGVAHCQQNTTELRHVMDSLTQLVTLFKIAQTNKTQPLAPPQKLLSK